MKNKQTIWMGLSLLIVLAFFLPWVKVNPDFDMFAASRNSYSAFTLVRGIHFAAPLVDSIGDLYGFPLASKLIYLGYTLLLIPLVGIGAICLSGIRHPKASWAHLFQFAFTTVVIMSLAILFNLNSDMRTLFFSLWRLGIGMPISIIAAIAGFVVYLLDRTEAKAS